MDQPAKYVGKKLKVSWQETEVYIPAAKGYFKIKEITEVQVLWSLSNCLRTAIVKSAKAFPVWEFPGVWSQTVKHIRIEKHVVFLGIKLSNFACKAQ